MTDEQRIKSIKKILTRLNKKPNVPDGLSEEEYKRYKHDILFNITDKYPNVSARTNEHERFFMISGKDIVKHGHGVQWSCGTLAKAFCYLNSQLPESERLTVKILISTHPDHLIDSDGNHTLPCVKMGNGKYYAIEPGGKLVSNRPRHPQFPDIPFILSDIAVGKNIYHIKQRMWGIPYKITAIMSWSDYEKNMSDFGKFLRTASVRDKKTKEIIATIETILKQINRGDSVGNIYKFCNTCNSTNLPIKIMSVQQETGTVSTRITIKIKNDLYEFAPHNKYCFLRKIAQDKYTILAEQTPAEYVKSFNENIMKEKSNGKVL